MSRAPIRAGQNYPIGVMTMHLWPAEGDTMNAHSGLTGDERGVAGAGPVSRQRWGTIVAVLLIVLGCVLAPLAGVAVWARNQVTNTDRLCRHGGAAGR
jgi:hypothetical protein